MSVILNHKIYNNSDWGFIVLNNHSYKLLKSTILIGRRDELKNEYDDFSTNEQVDPLPTGSLRRTLFESPFNDYFIIAAAMEIFLKSKLIKEGYLVHIINKNCRQFTDLFDKQKSTPVKFSDYCIKKGSISYEAKDMEPELTLLSINPNTLLKPKYIEALQLNPEIVRTLRMIINRRNRIHLPTDYKSSDFQADVNSFDVLLDFINQEIVDKTNEMKKLILPDKQEFTRFKK